MTNESEIIEKNINFIAMFILAKAITSPLFITIGLIFGNSAALAVGATLGVIGLMALFVMTVSLGFHSTLKRFRAIVKGISKALKRI